LTLSRQPCPCCGYHTLTELCEVCFWDLDPAANSVTIEEARENYRAFGASEERFLDNVRPPRPEELP
jgi:hypothetical protein